MTRKKLAKGAASEDIIQDARERIEEELPYIDIRPYSRTIIGLRLRAVDKKCGVKTANILVDEFGLEEYGFNKE